MSEKSTVDGNEASSTKIGNSIIRRLEHGANDEKVERLWMTKLASIHAEHSRQNGIEISEADRLIRNIGKYKSLTTTRACILDTGKVTNCLKANKGNTLYCETEAESYRKCVDQLLRDTARKEDDKTVRKFDKKESYLDAFEREYR